MQTFITRHVCARIDAPRFCSLTLIAELATQGAPTRAIRRPFLRTTADPLKMMYRFPDGAPSRNSVCPASTISLRTRDSRRASSRFEQLAKSGTFES